MKIGRYRFTVLIKLCECSRSCLLYALTNMTVAKGHLSKTKSQVIDIRTIGALVIGYYVIVYVPYKTLTSSMTGCLLGLATFI